MDAVLYVVAAVLIVLGLIGALIPAMPGIPLIFGGIWLIAGLDHYRHLGKVWLISIAVIGALGLGMDSARRRAGCKARRRQSTSGLGRAARHPRWIFLRAAGRRARPIRRRRAGRALGRQQRIAVHACGGQYLGWVDLWNPVQIGFVPHHGRAAGYCVVAEPGPLRSNYQGAALIVLQELSPHVLGSQPACEYRIDDARGAVNDVQRRRESEFGLACGMDGRVLIGHPAGVDRVHI